MNGQTDRRTNLYLLGFMGTGKSMIGRALADKLKMRFIDSDAEIEAKTGMSIKDIFEKFGEEHFRKLEREFMESGHPPFGCVVSCGGGMPCRDNMPELIKSKGISVCLFAPVDVIYERVTKSTKRPLMNVQNPRERIESLLKERYPFYIRSGICVSLGNQSAKQCIELVLRVYKNAVKMRKTKKRRLFFKQKR